MKAKPAYDAPSDRKPDYAYYSDAEVETLTTLSSSTIFRLRKEGRFPKSEWIAPGRKGTRAHKLHAFLEDPRGYREGAEGAAA